MRRAVWWAIRFYQLTFSAFLGRNCRFEPSCSHYTQQAVMRFGVLKGLILGAKRIARCHPWGGQGFDPVPEIGYPHRYQQGKHTCSCDSSSKHSTKKSPTP